MKLLTATTEDFIKGSQGSVDEDVLAGNNVVIPMPNANGFAVDDWAVIGYEGSETCEMVRVLAVTDISITATLKLGHKKGESIVVFRYDQRKFYGCTSADGSYSELTSDGSPVNIQVDNPQGTVIEYTGVEGYTYFKAIYWNSITSAGTALSDADYSLADESVRYCSLFAIRDQAGFTNNPYVTDGMLEVYRKRAENEIKSIIMTRYVLPLAEVPSIVENCATLLAAGYMDYKEFGPKGEGAKWLGEARAILKAIKDGKQRLLGADDTELEYIASANQIQCFPNTVDNSEGSTQQRQFTMGQRF